MHFWAEQQRIELHSRRIALTLRTLRGIVLLMYLLISLVEGEPLGLEFLRAL